MPDPLQSAKAYAFLLLKFRSRSVEEIRQRLKNRKFNSQVIKETLKYLKAKKLIDDTGFTKDWIEQRLRKAYGLQRIRQELCLKGIDVKIIERIFSEVKKTYREEEVVAQLVKNKLGQARCAELDKTKQKLYGYLLRRGFSPEIALEQTEKIRNI